MASFIINVYRHRKDVLILTTKIKIYVLFIMILHTQYYIMKPNALMNTRIIKSVKKIVLYKCIIPMIPPSILKKTFKKSEKKITNVTIWKDEIECVNHPSMVHTCQKLMDNRILSPCPHIALLQYSTFLHRTQ